jgi:peptidoglycan/xylan/chitin deacetylase (PgdA/CDA1 family)
VKNKAGGSGWDAGSKPTKKTEIKMFDKRIHSPAIALGYHDVSEDLGLSGKPATVSAAVYTLDRSVFAHQIDQMRMTKALLTFDDGAISGYNIVAPQLERAGLRGYFFITTDWIGRSGFLDATQIRDLSARGHVIGSHSCSHPERMSKLNKAQLTDEWTRSRAILEGILGASVTVASVPGGYYSRRVARVAARCGYKLLFTSEPTTYVDEVEGCRVMGRYSIKRGSSAALAGALASGRRAPRLWQWLEWNARKPVKFLAGDLYLTTRRFLLKSQCARTSSI